MFKILEYNNIEGEKILQMAYDNSQAIVSHL